MSKEDRKRLAKEIRVKKKTHRSMAINLMTCPVCGCVYHWGIHGYGNCPNCIRKAEDTKE